MRTRLVRILLAASLLGGAPLATARAAQDTAAGEVPPAEDAIPDAEPALGEQLAALMRAGITTTLPNSSRWYTRSGGQLFTGSYDWHSNVIAHWALLVRGRTEGDELSARFVLDRLGAEALRQEAEVLGALQHERRQTFPYDFAWFLMLLSELEHHLDKGADAIALDLRVQTERRLLDWLEDAEFPEPFMNGSFCGFYRSWLWAYLLLRWSDPITDDADARLDALRDERIVPRREELLAQKSGHPFDFLWVPAVLALAERSDPDLEIVCDYPLQEYPELPAAVKLSTVHIVGVEVSRIWPYALDAHRGVPGAESAYDARLKQILARPDLWRDDFTVCSHWVPQYLSIARWLRAGRP